MGRPSCFLITILFVLSVLGVVSIEESQNSRETGRFVAWLRGYRDHRQFFWNFFASSRFYKEGTSIISFP